MPTNKPSPQTAPIVRTRFVTTHNSVGFARKKAQTISFVERGFERLGLSHQTVGFSWCLDIVRSCSPWESFSWRQAGRFWFLAIFPSHFPWIAYFSFYTSLSSLSNVHVWGFDFPILILVPSAHTQSGWGVVVKAEGYDSVRCRVLNDSKCSFPLVLSR